MPSLVSIPKTIALLKACWQRAEERVRRDVETKYREADEEFITKLICGELRSEFEGENGKRQFEKQFEADLAHLSWGRDLTWIAHGLIARVVHHPRHIEAKTGGDFGFLVARPQVDAFSWPPVVRMHAQGLLVQAKRQRPNGKLGSLTEVQQKLLPSRLDYTAFVLYIHEMPSIRLAPFVWLCPDGRLVEDLEADFTKLDGIFPKTIDDIRGTVTASVLSSADIIEALSKGARGTPNSRIIREQICPDLTPNVQIEITWRDGKPPDPPDVVRHRNVQIRA